MKHYLPLLGIMTAGLVGFVTFSYDKAFQAVMLIGIAVSYVVWGIVHHHLHDDLYLIIVLEYIIIATLGLVVGFSLLFTA